MNIIKEKSYKTLRISSSRGSSLQAENNDLAQLLPLKKPKHTNTYLRIK